MANIGFFSRQRIVSQRRRDGLATTTQARPIGQLATGMSAQRSDDGGRGIDVERCVLKEMSAATVQRLLSAEAFRHAEGRKPSPRTHGLRFGPCLLA